MTSRMMIKLTLVFYFTSLIISDVWSNNADQKIPVYYINGETQALSLVETLSYFNAKSEKLTKEEIEEKEFSLTHEVPALNTNNYFWFRFQIMNTAYDSLLMYFCDEGQKMRTYFIDNETREYGTGTANTQQTEKGCAPIKFFPRESKEFYIRHWNLKDAKLKSTSLELRSELYKKGYKLFKVSKYNLTFNATLIILMFMFIVALIFFVASRQKFLGYYTLYILSFFIFYAKGRFNLISTQYYYHIEIELTYLIFSFYLLFVKFLFNTQNTNKRLDNLIRIFIPTSILFLIVSIFLQLFFTLEASYLIFNVYRAIMFFSIPYIVFLLITYNKTIISYIICIGNIFVIIPSFSTFLSNILNFKTVPTDEYLFKCLSTPWGFNYYMLHAKVGVVFEIIFFSIAIAIYLKHKSSETEILKEEHEKLALVSQDILQKKDLQKDDFTHQIITYIEQHKDNTIKIEHLSQHFGIGRTKLIQKIKQHTGKTPNQFIKFIKLSSAKEELLSTSLSIAQLSDKYGFSTPAHFSKQFKAMFGKSPKAFYDEITDNQT